MSRFALPAALLLAAAPAAAQVCQGYPSLTGSHALSVAAVRETVNSATDQAFVARWKIREQLALQASSGLSSLTGVHEYRASAGLVFELPVKRFSACAFAGLEHRYTWFDADAAATLSSFGPNPFSGGDWYLPVGLAFGYNLPISEDVSVFAYTQPHYVLFRSSSTTLVAPLRMRPEDVLLKGRLAVRSGAIKA